MTTTHRHPRWLILATAVVVLVGFGRPARAQDRGRSGVLDEKSVQAAVAQELFERNRALNLIHGDDKARRQRLESILRSRVDSVAKNYRMSEPHKKKLLLAGQGDIKRYLDSLQDSLVKLDDVSDDPDKIREASLELEQLRTHYASGMFKKGSIFAKTLDKILSETQTASDKKEIQERHQHRFRATVTWMAGTLALTLKLSNLQRRQLERVLIDETRAPQSFGSNDYYGLIFQASSIPETKLKPIFDDDQWQTLMGQFQEARRMEKTLKDGGFIPLSKK
jgi:hypothetical protein